MGHYSTQTMFYFLAEHVQWTFADIKRLFNQVKKSLPDKDAIKYSTAVDLLDWNKMKFNSFTGAECKAKLLELMESTRCYRTLTEIVIDAEKIFIFKDKGTANVRNEELEKEQVPTPENVSSAITNITLPQNVVNAEENNTITLRNRVVSMVRRDSINPSEKTPTLNTAKRSETPKLLNARKSNVQELNKNNKGMATAQVEGIEIDKEDNKYNVSLQHILKHTNWSQVVVNCGDKISKPSLPAKVPGKTIGKKARPGKRKYKRKINPKAANRSIKRPLVPFIQYFCAERKKLKRDNPDLTASQLAALAGQQYQQLPMSRKDIYHTTYYEQKAIYDEKIKQIEINGKRKIETEQCGEKKIKTASAESTEAADIEEHLDIAAEIGLGDLNTGDADVDLDENALLGVEDMVTPVDAVVIKVEKSADVDILANIESKDIGKDYWGLMWYADENLCKLTHTKLEDKMDVMYNLWRSLEDYETEEYIKKALELPYESREKMQERVLAQVNLTSYTPKATAK
uniref:HMG box domain-containing protein n=1 Tax=Strigamia maritima TaxID=126957 RepID=T1IJD1_STRMM